MELRYLRYFVAVAKLKHFTNAAEMLGISQPPLSQQIQRLEREIGTPLLRRLTRGVELTDAGKVFFQDACKILALSESAMDKARSVARGVNGILSLGIEDSACFYPKIFSILHKFQDAYPDVRVNLKTDSSAVVMKDLEEGGLDVIFTRSSSRNNDIFNIKIIGEEYMGVVLNASHPLAHQHELSLTDINDTPVIRFPQEVHPEIYALVHKAYERAGIHIENQYLAPQPALTLSMVIFGFGFALLPESMFFKHPQLTYHHLNDPELKTEIAFMWRKHEQSAPVKRLIHLLNDEFL